MVAVVRDAKKASLLEPFVASGRAAIVQADMTKPETFEVRSTCDAAPRLTGRRLQRRSSKLQVERWMCSSSKRVSDHMTSANPTAMQEAGSAPGLPPIRM